MCSLTGVVSLLTYRFELRTEGPAGIRREKYSDLQVYVIACTWFVQGQSYAVLQTPVCGAYWHPGSDDQHAELRVSLKASTVGHRVLELWSACVFSWGVGGPWEAVTWQVPMLGCKKAFA